MEKLELRNLSNAEVISRLESLVKSEKETTTEVIRHLAEVDRRRLYAELGYSSLFDYAVRNLGYSNSAATRRIKVARAAKKLPELFGYLEEDKVTLSSLNVVSDLLLGDNGKQVLKDIVNKSKDETEWLVASYHPVNRIRDKVEKVLVGQVPTGQRNLFISDENSSYNRRELDEKFKFSFSANQEFLEKLKRVQDLRFAGNAGDISLETIFGEALDLVIKKYCPKERQERREARKAKRELKRVLFKKKPFNPRHIPLWLRDEILKRDNYECSYEGTNGKCRCTVGLEIDHIVPFAKGGKTEISNLRVLCSTHNFLAAYQEFGMEFISQKIEQARAT